jgi:hypothetical protein
LLDAFVRALGPMRVVVTRTAKGCEVHRVVVQPVAVNVVDFDVPVIPASEALVSAVEFVNDLSRPFARLDG